MSSRWSRSRSRLRDYVDQCKMERGCERCGYNAKAINLQWHHAVPETKYKSIAQIVSEDRNIDKINEEIEKCICLCKVCHAKIEM